MYERVLVPACDCAIAFWKEVRCPLPRVASLCCCAAKLEHRLPQLLPAHTAGSPRCPVLHLVLLDVLAVVFKPQTVVRQNDQQPPAGR